MIAGHFGFAAGVKGREREVPLWALMLATVWLDVVFAPLLAAGVESIENVPGPAAATAGRSSMPTGPTRWSGRWSWPRCSGWWRPGRGAGGSASCWARWCSPTGCSTWSSTGPTCRTLGLDAFLS